MTGTPNFNLKIHKLYPTYGQKPDYIKFGQLVLSVNTAQRKILTNIIPKITFFVSENLKAEISAKKK